jgi:heptosyltransferase-2
MRILLIQTAFLGDVVLITPLIRQLKKEFPNSAIDVLVRKGNESLLSNNPHLETVLIWDKKKKYKSLFENLRNIRRKRYHEVVCVQRYFNAGMLTVFSGAKNKVGFDKNPWSRFFNRRVCHQLRNGKHEVERNFELIQHLVGDKVDLRPEIFPSNEDEKSIAPLKKGTYYCIAPASVWFTKQLPEEKWVELINKLSHEANVYLLGAPSDKDLAERIMQKTTHRHVQNLCGQLTLLQSAALMRDARRCYVNDSGPLHLASAVNAKVTAFFCSTVPAFGFGPLSDDAQTLEERFQLSCRPCGVHGHKSCPKSHFKCGFGIDLREVSY